MGTELTFASLFAGVGGFDLGLEAAGWRCAVQVEWDTDCQNILRRHWPNVPRWGDIATVNGADIPPVDAVVFGSPCQDLSAAGTRQGLRGERSGLFFEAVRIIKEMREATSGQYPQLIIWENVTGALSSSRGEDFAEVIDSLADLGALDIAWRVLDARWFGVPQRRRRVYAVVDLAGQRAGAIHAEPAGMRWHLGASGTKGRETAATTARCAPFPSWPLTCIGFSHTQGLSCQPSEFHFPTLRRRGCGHAVLVGDTLRRLTSIECERLQGWPDDHTRWGADGKEFADSVRYMMCGNGVASPVAQWIGMQINAAGG